MKKLIYTLLFTLWMQPLFCQNKVDVRNSFVKFKATALWITQVDGEIRGMDGSVLWTPEVSNNKIDVCIHSKTLNTENIERDNHLKSEDFLDTKKYPSICFVSEKVTEVEEGKYMAKGILSLHGVSKEITIPFSYKDYILKGSLEVMRRDYNIGENISKFTASNTIEIEITCVLIP